MPRDRRDVEAGLTKKGFRKSEGDHHWFIYFTPQGQKTAVKTKTSHGEKELHDKLISFMCKQCHLSKKDFLRLIDCPMAREEYHDALTQAGHI